MSSDQDRRRENAAGAVDETNAFLDACLSTGEPSGAIRTTVASVQNGLHAISAALHEPGGRPADQARHLHEVREAGRARATPPDAGPGRSMAAAMLRLARVVSRRAHRELRGVADADTLAFLALLPDLFAALAYELDRDEERTVSHSMCG